MVVLDGSTGRWHHISQVEEVSYISHACEGKDAQCSVAWFGGLSVQWHNGLCQLSVVESVVALPSDDRA